MPLPWNDQGNVRGFHAPARAQITPASLRPSSVSSKCSSTEQGPAISVNSPAGNAPGSAGVSSTRAPSEMRMRRSNGSQSASSEAAICCSRSGS